MDYLSLHNESAQDWTYVGEGNQNLVVRYTGNNTEFNGKVLRVLKTNHKQQSGTLDESKILFKQQFIEKIIQPLLGSDYVVTMQPVYTSVQFLTDLAAFVEHERPLFRREKGIITRNAPISFLMSDLQSIWPTSLTFELKPKWGFLPSSPYISSRQKQRYCRFCMHTHLRDTDSLSGYCPLDLYSGNAERIEKAVRVLLQPTSTQLKKTLKVSSCGSIEKDTEMLQELLRRILIKDPILTKLKTIQKTLDSFDIEHIVQLYHQQDDQGGIENIVHWESVITRYHQRLSCSKSDTDVLPAITADELNQRIFEYVLSMTFKDCSVMINVSPCTNGDTYNQITLTNDQIFNYDIKVIDIDLKSMNKIPFWYELDQSIVQYAKKTHFNKSDCFE